MNSLQRLATLLIACLLSAMPAFAAPNDAAANKATQIWQLLDYMAVDYAGAVTNGRVVNADEYTEMQEFSQTVEQLLAELPSRPELATLLQRAKDLGTAVADKAEAERVADLARSLASSLLAAYPVPIAPARLPDLHQGAKLYEAQCASCHGAEGRGDGPAAAAQNPPPIAFTDRDRARERSLFSLHQSITRGVEGTSMTAFPALSDDDRWALAFYISTMSFSKEELQAGKVLWASDKALRSVVPHLDALTQLSESSLERLVGPKIAGAALGYLRANPEALSAALGGTLDLTKFRLRESLAAFEKGKASDATRLALSAYLDGFEPVEPALAIKDKPLLAQIEKEMGAFRAAISKGDAEAVRAGEQQLQASLTRAAAALEAKSEDNFGVFLAALTILLREGVEALLVVVAMIAFLKKAERPEVLPYVHAGWIAALVAGGLTWFAATHLIEVSGASREITEGFAAIFAAVVLLAVGIWMHQKSLAGRWQAYIRDKLSAALSKRSAIMLFVLAFVTVYREVFETVLFYAALWTDGAGGHLLAGLGLGIVILTIVAAIMLRTSARLPISQFFAVSSALVALLAVVLIGKGVAALQEAGMLDVTPIDMPGVDVLGVYPSMQTVTAQLVVLFIVVGSMTLNAYANRKAQ